MSLLLYYTKLSFLKNSLEPGDMLRHRVDLFFEGRKGSRFSMVKLMQLSEDAFFFLLGMGHLL
ncbi:hypothetical protein KH172YL63_22420 [Bacillus sp. KH172YL63]|nr:hypothetical protein KH172YL63_22420 [Bacillus sp. KH172YL63]